MTAEGNDRQAAKHIVVSWLKAGWKTGAMLGGTYGAGYGAIAGTGFFWFILIGLVLGCVIGFCAGVVAGLINGAVIGALTRPLALRRGHPLARRLHAALIAVVTTEAALLPVQLTLGRGAPIDDIALLTMPILAAALWLATTIAPAGSGRCVCSGMLR
jgi:hypothetical protein